MTSLWWSLLALLVGIAAGLLIARPRIARRESAVYPVAPARSVASSPSPSEAPFAPLVRALPIGVILVDRTCHIEFANAAAGTTFGFDPARSIALHIIEAVPNVELERRIGDALRGEASVAPLMLTGAPGQRTYRVSVYPLTDDHRQSRRVVVFSDDQTALVRLDRARKEFLSNVSHELRTPLSSIKLMLETVLEAPEEEARDLFVPQALAQVDRLTALVGQLLEQARAESGQMQLSLRDVDLEEVARPIVASSSSTPPIKASPSSSSRCVQSGSKPIPTGYRKYSSTSSTTRCVIRWRAAAFGSSSMPATATRCCACATPAKEYPTAICRTSSSAFTSWTDRERVAAAAQA